MRAYSATQRCAGYGLDSCCRSGFLWEESDPHTASHGINSETGESVFVAYTACLIMNRYFGLRIGMELHESEALSIFERWSNASLFF